MKWDTTEPCESCPYRKDARIEYWDKGEFAQLLKNDADPIMGAIYGCHQTRKLEEPSICGGWLLDQQNRGVPSIQLRLALIRSKEAMTCLDKISDGGHERYSSIEEMIEANFPELLEGG